MNRKNSIDLLRVISAMAVIVIHTVSAPVTNSTVEIDAALQDNLNLIHTLMNWSVPVFFMITGYCLLRKMECTYRYCFLHIIKYVRVLLTVGLFYALLEEIFACKKIDGLLFVRSVVNVISGNLWDHMWFVYAIIGIYLVMPVIHSFMQQGERNILMLTSLLFSFHILLPAIEKWLPVGVNLPFDGYLFYVCFGGAVAKLEIDKKQTHFIYLAGLLSVVWIVMGAGSHEFGYKHMAVCLIAMSIFLIGNKIELKSNRLLLCVSECTWGMYLIHPFFINFAIKLLKIDLLRDYPYEKLFVFAMMIFVASFGTTYVLRKIPFVRGLF